MILFGAGILAFSATASAIPAWRGDVNSDGVVNISDVVLTHRSLGGGSMTGTAWYDHGATGDVNCDG